MALPTKSLLILVALPMFTVCAATLYYYHVKDKEWKQYLKRISKYHEEIKVPIESVGRLIGKNGLGIRELQDMSHTRITFDGKNQSCEKFSICCIYGSKENVESAKKMILDIVSEKGNETEELKVPQIYCGRLIGRCGDNIRAITKASNASINISERKCSSGFTSVIIKGRPSEIAIAKSLINAKIKECLQQQNNQPRSPRSRTKNRKGNGLVTNEVPQYERLVGVPNESMIQVYVSSVASPSHFWLQLITPKAVDLDHLVDDMSDYYNKEENRKLHKLEEVKKGQIVACKFKNDEKWYRVEIFSVEVNKEDPDKSKVDVFYVDYGDSAFYNLEDLLELKPEFLQLKFQAIEASMAGIKPRNTVWEEEVTEVFEDMVYSAEWKVMLAQIVCQKEKENSTHGGLIPYVRLYDPEGPQGVDIGSQLIEKGLAIRDETDEPQPSCAESDEEW